MKKLLIPIVALIMAVMAGGGWYVFGRKNDPINNARILLTKGDMRGAQIELRNAIKDNPKNAEAHVRLAQLQLQTSDPVAAEKELKLARDLKYDATAIGPLLAQSYMAQQRFADVLSDVKPNNADPVANARVLVLRAVAQIGLQDVAGARASLAEAQRLEPGNQDAPITAARVFILDKDLPGAERQIDRALAINDRRADALVLRGQLQAAKGDGPGALEYIERAVAAAPGDPGIRLERANQYIASGEDAKARADIDKVLLSQPNSGGAIYLDMVLKLRAGRYADADLALERLTPIIDRFPRGRYFQALIKANLGQTEQAVDSALRYVAAAPADLDGIRLLARIELGARRPERAVAALVKAVAAGAADAQTFDLLGRTYALQGKTEEAASNFRAAAALAPTDPAILTRLASTQMLLGDTTGATAALEKSLDLAPAQSSAGEALVAAALSAGDADKAQAALDRLRKQGGDNEAVGLLTGMVSLARLDLEGARAQFAEVAKQYPDSKPARLNLAKVLLLQDRRAEAEAMLTEMLVKDHADSRALEALLRALVQDQKFPQAITAVEAARAAEPSNPALTAALADLHTRSKQPKKALDVLHQALVAGTPLPILLGAQARALAADGDVAGAKVAYRQILDGKPTDLEARRALVELSLNNNDTDGAKQALRDGLQLSPGNLGMMNTLVFVEQRSAGIAAALAIADELRRDPANMPAAAVVKGDAYMSARRFGDAAAAFSAELKTNPSSMLALRVAGALASGGGQEQAAQQLRTWLAQHPNDVDAAQMLASLDISTGRNQDAEQYLDAVLKQRPNDAVALNNLAWVYQAKGDARSLGLAQRAHLLAPSSETSDTLGWIMTNRGDAVAALPLLQTASLQRPEDRSIKFHLATALAASGKRDEAAQILTPILSDTVEFDGRGAARTLLGRIKAGN